VTFVAGRVYGDGPRARRARRARPPQPEVPVSMQVVLVDERDVALGSLGKQEAHLRGLLHRAFSVFVFNSRGEMLLQRRAASKYHSGGLWTNACCSHPAPGERVADAALRRLAEEMGIHAEAHPAFSFVYRADVGGGLVEHEYDHVLLAWSDATPGPDAREVEDWRWAAPEAVEREVAGDPGAFTAWFRMILGRGEWPPLVARGRAGPG
jgi:isopentenyl-diphosphate Delta-isomerase